ncbi:MAG: hypothetical protein K9K67_03965 [Bacteriovoracaceae bacterium]|nr:hypothetical protein [Bacteriovoracaceae bacterium]
MRGTFFVSGVEIVLDVLGETWQQGQDISVTGELKPHGENIDLTGWSLKLVLADLRKVKKRDPKAFKLLQELSWSDLKLDSAKEFEHQFIQSIDTSISDGTYTLALLAGPDTDLYSNGLLNLTITPWKPIELILELFENFQRFKVKSLKNKATKLEAKLTPPATRELGAVEGLDLLIEPIENGLGLNFTFNIKKLSYGTAGVEAKKHKIVLKKEFIGKDLFSFGDALNQDTILKAFEEIIEQVKTRSLM